MIRKLFFWGLSLLCFFSVVGAAALSWLVVFSPGDEIRQGNIEKILAMESPVYYSDGESKVGVFFEDAHRQYVPFERIPKTFVNAMVAAEDNRFFDHHGIDFKGLTRAMAANLRAGRVIQGGSTITQQTAKNLFKRKGRSVVEKVKELIYALRLEYHYPKQKIFEFYANQFYVSGNGRGLGLAARYYFDKEVEDLDVVECSFIAGSVKKPNAYNPFIKRDEAAVAKAKELSKMRAGYVLGQMKRLGMINAREYEEYRRREVPFNQGTTYFSLNTVMDLVREAMEEPAIQDAFLRHGIENVATSGIRIVTTIEKQVQERGVFALRKELSRLDARLRGYARDEVQATLAELRFGNKMNLHRDGFLVGRIEALGVEPKPLVRVSFEKEARVGGASGVIEKSGLVPLFTALVRYERHRWSELQPSDFPMLFDRLRVGDLVYVSVRGETDNGDYRLSLEKYPELQGAVLAFRHGRIRAMVGGMENSFFNRSVYSRRAMGSVFKPLVYCAAMQLGWSNVDMLSNARDVFVYQNMPYFPRPDHLSPHQTVSMNWAGIKSENLATIWLLYHLVDHLSPGNFKEVVSHLGLGRHADESYNQYKRRVRDDNGILVNDEAIKAAAFGRALAELEPDLVFSGKSEEFEFLRSMHYGNGFERFMADAEVGLENSEQNAGKKQAEALLHQKLLKRNYIRLREARAQVFAVRQELEQETVDETLPLAGFYSSEQDGRLVYTDEQPEVEGWQPVDLEELRQASKAGGDFFWDEISLDGAISVSTVGLIDEFLLREYDKLATEPAYGDAVLHAVPDFRIMVALHYLMGLCQTLGISSPLDPVLSFPLGSNVITPLEVAKSYEGMVGAGRFVAAGGDDEDIAALIIDRIEDSEGQVIYRPELRQQRVVDRQTSIMVSDILRNVVKYGTGRYADQAVRLHSADSEREELLRSLNLHVPVLGKTGTANRFTNASFAGVVPGMTDDGKAFSVEDGYVLAAYVGFDDNAPMVRGSTRISGASGALPVWAELANAILRSKGYGDKPDLVDYSFSTISTVPIIYPNLGQMEIPISTSQGGRVMLHKESFSSDSIEGDGFLSGLHNQATTLTFGEVSLDGTVKPQRQFRPYWQVEKRVQ